MSETQVIENKELSDFLELVLDQKVSGTTSYLAKGRWHTAKILIIAITSKSIQLELQPDSDYSTSHNMQVDQPVGITFQHEFNKYLLESVVVGYESSVNEDATGRIVIKMPEKAEKMQRRAYVRVDVPSDMTVKVLFWHRGYSDNTTEVPLENYWQGKMIDLSGGGMLVSVDEAYQENFRNGQLVGLQFTSMAYERPIIVEAVIRHVGEPAQGSLKLGIEFIGLEATADGREKIRHIGDTIDSYQQHSSNLSDNKSTTITS